MNEVGKVPGQRCRCLVYLVPEEVGGFSVYAATLRGAVSQGETEEEALSNIREALEGVLASYRDLGMSVPWAKSPEAPEPGALTRWVDVDA